MHPTLAVATIAALAAAPSAMSGVTHHREHVGQCFTTAVAKVETRLVDGDTPVKGSGSAIELADGHYNVSYDTLPAIERSRPGDPIKLCVIALPHACPKGDHRGIAYRGRNLRTGLTWKATDAEHGCGGA